MKPRRTRQLAAVYSVVCSARDHPTAEQVLDRVQTELPRISLGTVYRNLEKLVAQGDIQLVQLGDRKARYDGMAVGHDHFVCDMCGGVTDLVGAQHTQTRRSELEGAGFGVRTESMVYFGCCRTCNARAEA